MVTIKPVLFGVCAWVAKKLNIDVSWVRIGAVVLTLLGVGSPILIYIVMFILLRLRVI
jgi:phage shock protein C